MGSFEWKKELALFLDQVLNDSSFLPFCSDPSSSSCCVRSGDLLESSPERLPLLSHGTGLYKWQFCLGIYYQSKLQFDTLAVYFCLNCRVGERGPGVCQKLQRFYLKTPSFISSCSFLLGMEQGKKKALGDHY